MKSENNVGNYGWETNLSPNSCGYIGPRIIKILKRFNVRRVADLGSGNGYLSSELAKNKLSVVGVEYDEVGFKISQQHYPNINFYKLGVQDDPGALIEAEGVFDAVISTEVIEHLYSPHLLPIFSKKILREDGILVISTPYHGYLKNLALSIFNYWDKHHTVLWHGGHIKFWSKKTLTQLLLENRFEVVEFHGVGRIPFLWKSMIVVAKKLKFN